MSSVRVIKKKLQVRFWQVHEYRWRAAVTTRDGAVLRATGRTAMSALGGLLRHHAEALGVEVMQVEPPDLFEQESEK